MKKHFKELGFTLVETILGIAIIGLAIAAAASLTQTSLRVGRENMRQLVAYHLAEEGLEIARNTRDTNWLQNKPWRNSLQDVFFESANLITLAGGEKFTRTIKITSVTEGADASVMKVESSVSAEKSPLKSVSLSAEFTDWKKGPL
ncbi:prepilin-type N-terminal cleavage/methylation domain-containing protein [Candidatus Peregrinibacteria bacterium]|nr:prepilin-type N-terminal cleavage/methylation domain-containing protein [Candidatus Peregrinibacteria bacterium]